MSTKVKVRTPRGGTDGTAELPADVFDVAANMALMHQVVVAQLAAARQGTHSTKTRGEVRGGGRKPYRQKGTGRARQGSVRAPQFAGGGVVHGPTPRDYAQRTPKKMKVAALRGSLSDRARAGRVHVVSAVVDEQAPSTKAARKLVESISERLRVLVVVGRDDQAGWLSLRNLPTVHVIAPDQLNTYDVLVNDEVVFTADALRTFLAGVPRGQAVTHGDADKPVAKAEPKAAAKAEPKAAAKAGTKTAAKPADKPAAKAAAEPADKPAAKASTKAAAKPADKPATKASTKAAGTKAAGTKAADKPAQQPAGKPAAKPASKPAGKPAAKPKAAKPAADEDPTAKGPAAKEKKK